MTFADKNGVAPPRAAAANHVDTDIVNGKTLFGFRVPTVIASPFTKGNPSSPQGNHLVFDHTSVLKLIEWRWGLAPLTPRGTGTDIDNLACALNLSEPDASVPTLPAPQAPLLGSACRQNLFGGFLSTGGSSPATEWQQLGQVAPSAGYLVKDIHLARPARPWRSEVRLADLAPYDPSVVTLRTVHLPHAGHPWEKGSAS